MRSAPLTVALLALAALARCSCEDPPPPGCMSDGDCRMGERCTMGGACVLGAECVKEEECSDADPRKTCNLETNKCDFLDGFADECDSARPCPFGEFCSNLLGRCLDASASRDCVRRSQCPSGQICDRNANKCIPDLGCYGDQFCEDGEICDLVNRVCRAVAIECTSCVLDASSCTGGTLCDVDTKECVNGPADAKCREGEHCDPLGRCVQCTNQQECGPGLFCNVATGHCESNVQCVDDVSQCPGASQVMCVTCNLPQICDPRTRRCSAPATPCDSDLECDAEERCDHSVDPPVCVQRLPDCLNDLFDTPRNESPATASALDSNAGPLYAELKVCQGDQDWYRIDVSAGTYLTIDARFRNDDGDIELQLFLPDGRTLLDESRKTTDNERVELEVGTNLSLLLRVFLAVPTIREVPYTLIVARDPGQLCADDGNEPDDSPSLAKSLAADTPYEGRVCTGDPDWFALRGLAAQTQIHAQLDFTDNLGDLDLELYRSGSALPVLSSATLTDREELTYDASFGGDFYLRVVPKGGDTNVYSLRVELREGVAAACSDDALEPNDGPLVASSTVTLAPGPAAMTLCAGDEDWYRVSLEPGAALKAEIGFMGTSDLDMALYSGDTVDRNTSPVALSDNILAREYLAYRDFVGGDFLLRVYGHTPQSISPYELNIDVEESFTCLPDTYDQQGVGNTEATAALAGLPPVRLDDLTNCTGDDDWFTLFLEAGFINVIGIHFLADDAQLEFALSQGGAPIFTTVGQAPSNVREVLAPIAGAGFAVVEMRVFKSSGIATPYDLTVDLIPIFSCFLDFAEPNNTRGSASMIAAASTGDIRIGGLTLCATEGGQSAPGDEDWYVINPPVAGARIEASIEFPQGDLSLELFSPNGGPRACVNFGENRCYSDGNDLSEHITFTATVAQPYFLKVGSVYGSPNVPIRPADADTPYELFVDYVLP